MQKFKQSVMALADGKPGRKPIAAADKKVPVTIYVKASDIEKYFDLRATLQSIILRQYDQVLLPAAVKMYDITKEQLRIKPKVSQDAKASSKR